MPVKILKSRKPRQPGQAPEPKKLASYGGKKGKKATYGGKK